jgi:hypothetical protein
MITAIIIITIIVLIVVVVFIALSRATIINDRANKKGHITHTLGIK